jgi:carbon-monoxide dehydrogenase large subunit
MKGTLIGRSIPRVEDRALLTGKGRYVDDIHLPGMLHAAFVRSPHAHAAVRGIDVTAAAAAPGVRAVLTLEDLLPFMTGSVLRTALPSPAFLLELHRPVLASTEVTHVGEAVAVVLAADRYLAEDAAALVQVDYDPLPVVADLRAGARKDSPTVQAGLPHNIAAELRMEFGDVDAVFRQAPHVYAEELLQHRGGSHSMECRGVVARHDAMEDLLTVWTSSQTPQAARGFLCDLLGRTEDRVRVVLPDVGGGFGPKLAFYIEEAVVAVSALMLGVPVKWIEDRREHFVSTTQERDQVWNVEIAVDDEGRVLGVRGHILHDHGAYSVRGTNIPYSSASAMTLPYRVPAYRMQVQCVATNKVPVTPVRGAGQPQGVFAMERLLDRVARELDIDRATVRRRNLVPPEAMPYATPMKNRAGTAIVLDSGDYPACMAQAMKAADWDGFPARQAAARAQGKRLGIGLANSVEGTGRGPYDQVKVRIVSNGTVQVFTAAAPMGQGTRTMLTQIVAELLGGDANNVQVFAGDTGNAPLAFGGFNSRQAVMTGSSAFKAAGIVREKLLVAAAAVLKCEVDDLDITGRTVTCRSTGAQAGFGELARASVGLAGFLMPNEIPGLEATEHVTIDAMAYANASAVVELEVDADIGAVTLHKVTFAHDCGTVIHPQIVEGQIIGGLAHGIGNALYEWMGFNEDAQPVTTNFAEYLLVTATEMPEVQIVHQESPSPLNALGIKGVGEAGVLPIPAAIASAVDDALADYGVIIRQVPIAPDRLLASIEAARRPAAPPRRELETLV